MCRSASVPAQSRTLVRRTPESDIRSRDEFMGIGYVKDYDAVITVSTDEPKYRFALEYERTQKAHAHTRRSRRGSKLETDVHHFLYLVSNYDLLLVPREEVRKLPPSAYGRICSVRASACQSKAITRLCQLPFSPCQGMASPVWVAGAHPLRNMEPDLPIALGLSWD